MVDPFRASRVALLIVLLLPALSSLGAQVRGSVDASPPPKAEPTLGYTKTRVATHAVQHAPPHPDVAVFLAPKESGVIPPPTEPYRVSLLGLRFEPNIAACVIDGKVAFTNEDRNPATIVVEEQSLGIVAPGQTVVYDCKTAEPKLRRVRVKEWPHIRGGLFVGEIGVVGQVNPNGAFSISAPQGKYEVQLITEGGPIASKPVEVKAGDVDVGRLAGQSGETAGGGNGAANTIEPAGDVPAQPKREAGIAPVKKDPALAAPAKKEPGVLPIKIPQVKKKEPGARPSTEDQELDFGEQ